MSVRSKIPVSVTVTGANVGALNTAVAAAVTAALAVTDYIPNTVAVSPVIAATITTQDVVALYQAVTYEKWLAES